MKHTPLTGRHEALGARMAEFAGYKMPISYTGIREEHLAVRRAVGIFDVSHMGEFIVRGRQALDLVQYVTSNDASRLDIGDAQYSCLPNEHGGIVDDLLVYRLSEDQCAEGEQAFMLVVNAANIEKDWQWITSHAARFDVHLVDISEATALMAVQGPKAARALQPLTDIDLASMKYYTFRKGTFAGVPNVLVSATGYTGSGGFELYVAAEHAAQIWDAVFEAGQPHGIQPCGLGARDTLRLEMGYCLYGNDIDDTTSPLEAGLSWITKLNKGTFVGVDVLRKQKAEGVKRRLIGFVVDDRRVPRHGYSVCDAIGQAIGNVTSGTLSPCLQKPIGMGYVEVSHAQRGTTLTIEAGRKQLNAIVTRPPFVDPSSC